MAGIDKCDPVFRREENIPVFQRINVIQAVQPLALQYGDIIEISFRDVIHMHPSKRGTHQKMSFRAKAAAVDLFAVRGIAHRAKNLSCLQQEDPPVRSDGGNVAVPVSGQVIGVVDLPEGGNLFQAAVQGQDLHAAGCPDIIISVRTFDDSADGIGGKPPALVNHIDDLLVDRDGEAIVIGADPQAPFIVCVQAVDIADRIVFVHPLKFLAIVAVKPCVGSDPQDSVIGFGNVICLPAGKAVVIAEDRLHIIAVIRGGNRGSQHPGSGEGGQGRKEEQQQNKASREHPLHGKKRRMREHLPEEAEDQVDDDQSQNLVHKVQIEFPEDACDDLRPFPFEEQVDYTVSPDISGHAGMEQVVQRNGDCRGRDSAQDPDDHGSREGIKAFPVRQDAHKERQGYAGEQIAPVRMEQSAADQVAGDSHHAAADGSEHVSTPNGTEGIQPERKVEPVCDGTSQAV